MRKVKIFAAIFFLISSVSIINPTPVNASFFGDIINGIKETFVGSVNTVKDFFVKKEVSIDSDIALVSRGDINKNGQIDSGDLIQFTYTIKNTTKDTYKFSTLKTNIDANSLNSLGNLQGAVNLGKSDGNILLTNLEIRPSQVRIIKFEARINLDKRSNHTIVTEANLLDDKNQSIAKAKKEAVEAKKMNVDLFNQYTKSN